MKVWLGQMYTLFSIKRSLKYLLIVLLFLLLFTLISVFWIAGTQSGTRWLIERVLVSIPELTIQKFEGRLIDSLALNGIHYHNEKVDVTVALANIKWQPRKLLSTMVSIQSLQLSDITIQQLAASKVVSSPQESSQSIKQIINGVRLPVDINIDKFELHNISFQAYGAEKTNHIEHVAVDANVIGQRLAIDTLVFKNDMVDVQAQLVINELYDQINDDNKHNKEKIKGNVQWTLNPMGVSKDAPKLNGQALIKGNLDTLQVDAQLASPYTSFVELAISDPLGDIKLLVNATAHNINLKYINPRWPDYQLTGNIKADGVANNYVISSSISFNNLSAQELSQKNVEGQLVIKAQGSKEKITFSTISLNGDAGQLDGKGKVIIQPALAATISIVGKEINPGIFAPQWPGNINVSAVIKSNTLALQNPSIKAEIKASGSLREYPIALDINAESSGDHFTINTAEYRSGKSKVSASAVLTHKKYLSAQWLINSANLQELLPDAKGSLVMSATIDEANIIDNPVMSKIKVDVQAASLSVFDLAIDKANATIDIDWRKSKTPKINNVVMKASNINFGNIDLFQVVLQSAGNIENHSVNVNVDSHQGKIDMSLSGQLNQLTVNPEWKFSIDVATLTPPNNLASWRLEKPVSGSLSQGQQIIHHHCWKSNTAGLCFDMNNTMNTAKKYFMKSAFSLSDLPANYFSSLMPEALMWQGSIIDGDGQLALSSGDNVSAKINISSSDGRLTWEGSKKALVLQAGTLLINANQKNINAALSLPIEQDTGIKALVSLEHKQKLFVRKPLNGELSLQLNNLDAIEPFITDASDIKGSLLGRWVIGGSIDNPWIDGELSLSDAQLRLNTPGIFLEKVNLLFTGDKRNGIAYQASAYSGEGQLMLNGQVNDVLKKDSIHTIKIKGDQFQVVNTDEAKVFISPEIKVVSSHNKIHIEGDIIIPKADITPKQIPASIVSVSEDQIIIDHQARPTASTLPQEITAKLHLVLGDEVSVDGFGFKGKANGRIGVTKNFNEPTLANGKINIVDGEYRAFGQGLVIEKGLILFSDGPIAKPGVDIKALRRPADGITVGVYAQGSISQPALTLFSEPAMNQSEQLSWLVLGRPLENSSEGENNAINQLLLSMSLGKTDSVLSRFGETLNLDTVGIQSGSGEAGAANDNDLAELVLGKYLSPDLYIRYGIGLFKPVNVLSLEYSLGRTWKLKTETSTEASGGDLIYSIER